jgi:DNA-directed RNA polymerase alpha subunit
MKDVWEVENFSKLVGKFRKVFEPSGTITRTQRGVIKKRSVDIVFSATFLDYYDNELDRTPREMSDLCQRVLQGFKHLGIQTLEDLNKKKYVDIIEIPRLGAKSMALILDVAALLGCNIKDVHPLAGKEIQETDLQAHELARILGLQKKEQ